MFKHKATPSTTVLYMPTSKTVKLKNGSETFKNKPIRSSYILSAAGHMQSTYISGHMHSDMYMILRTQSQISPMDLPLLQYVPTSTLSPHLDSSTPLATLSMHSPESYGMVNISPNGLQKLHLVFT